jgi:hypothetical protein
VTNKEIAERFLHTQRELLRMASEAEGLDLARVKVASPANRLLRLSMGIWFAATVAHAQRHFEQAARVVREEEFPA